MTTQHTTGPWFCSEDLQLFAETGEHLADLDTSTEGLICGPLYANARLIAAAPDLLALAYDFGQMLNGMDPYTVDDAAIMRDKIKAIIARATATP